VPHSERSLPPEADPRRQPCAGADRLGDQTARTNDIAAFIDGRSPGRFAFPLAATPILILIGMLSINAKVFLTLSVLAASLVGGAYFAILSIASDCYPSAIRANGGRWAASADKVGGIARPIIGAHVLASGLPIVRSFAILALCPTTEGALHDRHRP
jgi:hypothetical protein